MTAWVAAAPLAPPALAFVGGVGAVAVLSLAPSLLWALLALALLGAAALLVAERSLPAGLLLTLAMGALGVLRGLAPGLPPHHIARLEPLPSPVRIEGRLLAEPVRWRQDRTRLLLEAQTVLARGERHAVAGSVQLTLYGEPPPLGAGQRIAAEARLFRPVGFRNPGGFDYPGHLARQGIHLVGHARGDRVDPLSAEAPGWPVRVRRWTLETFRAHLPPASAALLAGLLLGERTDLPRPMDDAFRRAGVYHVLAVSGSNVALIASTVFLALSLVSVRRRHAAVAAAVSITGFALVVGGDPSVVRATIMGLLLLGALLLEREASVPNSIAFAALLILLWRPGDLWDPGFQLSFAATLGIVSLAPPATAALRRRGWPGWLAASVAVSLAAQAAVLPIMLAHFNQLSLVGPAANLLVVPLAAVALTLGLAALLLSLASGALGDLLFQSVWLLLLALRAAVLGLAALPGAMVHGPAPHPLAVLAFYVLLATTPLLRRGRLIKAGALAAAVLGLGLTVSPWLSPADGRLRVTFLDVGQGDAALVELPDGRRLLVDAGPGGERRFDVGERVLAPFLWNRAATSLDAVVMSHADPDHAGGLPAIFRRFRVGELWLGAGAEVSPEVRALAARQGTLLRRLRAGDRLWLGRVAVTVLHPPGTPLAGSPRGPASDENNNSLALRVDWGLASFLFTGDIEHEAEADLVRSGRPLEHLVLKVAHHGSRSSTTEAFLEAARPRLAVISAGARNPFRHPHPEVLERLQAHGVRIYRTDRDGAVSVETDGASLDVRRWGEGRRSLWRLEPA